MSENGFMVVMVTKVCAATLALCEIVDPISNLNVQWTMQPKAKPAEPKQPEAAAPAATVSSCVYKASACFLLPVT